MGADHQASVLESDVSTQIAWLNDTNKRQKFKNCDDDDKSMQTIKDLLPPTANPTGKNKTRFQFEIEDVTCDFPPLSNAPEPKHIMWGQNTEHNSTRGGGSNESDEGTKTSKLTKEQMFATELSELSEMVYHLKA